MFKQIKKYVTDKRTEKTNKTKKQWPRGTPKVNSKSFSKKRSRKRTVSFIRTTSPEKEDNIAFFKSKLIARINIIHDIIIIHHIPLSDKSIINITHPRKCFYTIEKLHLSTVQNMYFLL